MKLKRLYIIVPLITITFLVFVFLLIRAYEKEILNSQPVSSKESNSNNIEIWRDKYYLRKFIWSGIFPLYGGYIPDPHFLYSKPVDVTQYLSPVVNSKNIRYQLIDVNPFFENRTSENILGMEIDGVPYEYKLKTPSRSSPSILQDDEPDSAFLYNDDTLYFVLKYGWDSEFLIYEVSYPFTENKDLNYHLIDIKKSNVPTFLDFPISQDQIDHLLKHTDRDFFHFYTQFLNKDYAFDQIRLDKGDNEINITAYYGATLNINRNKIKDVRDKEYALKINNLYEYITSIQQVEMADYPETEKIVIELIHQNYYDYVSLGDSFETSEFAIRKESKFIFIPYDYIDRLLSYIDQYTRLREEKIESIVYFKEKTPFLIEAITQIKDELSQDRSVLTAFIFPTSFPQKKKSLNSTEYALPNGKIDEDYLFVMHFNDGYSIKLSYKEVQKLETFLGSIKLLRQDKP